MKSSYLAKQLTKIVGVGYAAIESADIFNIRKKKEYMKREEFKKAIQPIMNFLNKYYKNDMVIVIDSNKIRIFRKDIEQWIYKL